MDRGHAGATTNRIAERAGVSVGTLYEYFANKEAIFDALIEHQIDAIVSAVANAEIDPDESVGGWTGRLVRLSMAAMTRGPDFVRALEQVPGSSLRMRLDRARALVIGRVRELLASRPGEIRVDDVDLAAFIVVSSAEGIAMNASAEVFGDRLAEEVAALINLYLTGETSDRAARTPHGPARR
jgi:AcrR family transcriptional regulator